MRYAAIRNMDVSNGSGIGVALFTQGCLLHCKNCFNQETWNFLFGKTFTDETLDYILKELNHDYISGFSLLGGEPFEPENQAVLANVLEVIKNNFPDKIREEMERRKSKKMVAGNHKDEKNDKKKKRKFC